MREFSAQDQSEVLDLVGAFIAAIQHKYSDKVDAFNALFALAATADEIVRAAPPEYREELLTVWDQASATVKQEDPSTNH